MLIRDGAWTLHDHDMASGRCVWHHFDGEKDVYRVDYPVDNLISENLDRLICRKASSTKLRFGRRNAANLTPRGL